MTSTSTATFAFCRVPLTLLSLAGAERRRDYTASAMTPSGANLLLFEFIEGQTTVFQSPSKFPGLDSSLAREAIERALGHAEVVCCFRVPQPGIRLRAWRVHRANVSDLRGRR